MPFTVCDNICDEVLQFVSRIDAEMEAERRLIRHRNGYDLKHNHISGCNAIIVYEGDTITIIAGGENEKDS